MLQRSGASPIWIPDESITAIRTERGIAGKALTHDGILAIRWRLPSGTEIDTGFRGDDRRELAKWIEEDAVMVGDKRSGRAQARPCWFSTTGGCSPAPRSARSGRRWARRCSPPGCPATRRP